MIGLPSFRRSRNDTVDLPARIDALAAAVALADGRLPDTDVAFARHVVDKAGVRLRHGTEHTLVALLGATGSGKSSLANAIAGSAIATTGVRRPTTSSTLALVWGSNDTTALLDWLEIDNRHLVDSQTSNLDGLVLLDVPDHDSVAVSHRLEMERIAEHADLLVWVTDPEKYADEAMHHYLRLLHRHDAVTMMVLNKSDRLTPEELDVCATDLERLLADDGIDRPGRQAEEKDRRSDTSVYTISATSGLGVDAVIRRLGESVADQRAIIDRLTADVAAAGDALASHVTTARPVGIGNDTAHRLAADLADASGIEIVASAAARSYRRDAARSTGWPLTRWMRRLRPDPLRRLHLDSGDRGRSSLPTASGVQVARARSAIRAVADEASAGLDQPWPELFRSAAHPEPSVLHDQLDVAVADAVRSHTHRAPRWWTMLGALQLLLVLTALAGALWLTALAANNWLQLPEFDTPDLSGIPIPTAMLIVGLAAGWVLALLARQLARIGGARRATSVRHQAAASVSEVGERLVLAPLRSEIAARNTLIEQLLVTGADVSAMSRYSRSDAVPE